MINVDSIKAIMPSCSLTDAQIEVYVGIAYKVTDKIFTEADNIDCDLEAEVTRWLAAHMIECTTSRNIKRERLGDAEVEYQTLKFEQGLSSTYYGQMVLVIDPTGKMANVGKRGATMYTVPNFDE